MNNIDINVKQSALFFAYNNVTKSVTLSVFKTVTESALFFAYKNVTQSALFFYIKMSLPHDCLGVADTVDLVHNELRM